MRTTPHGWRGPRPDRHPHRQPPFGGPEFDAPGFGPGGHRGPRGGFGPGFGPDFGPGFGPGFERGRGRRGARRGDVRAAVLTLLLERPMHGYELIQEIEQRSGGVWRPSPGSIYPTLQLLADEGLVSGDESGGRRLFTLTDAGREQAQRHQDRSPFAGKRDETFEAAHRFRSELGQLGMAVRQVAMVGTEAQQAEILDVLAEARRRAYQLLAEGGSGEADAAPQTPPEE
jgi:DNA-binding PadR family transcriptional regulator